MPDQPVPRQAHVRRNASTARAVNTTGVRHKAVEQGELLLLRLFTFTRLGTLLQSVVAAVVARDHFRYPALAGFALAVLLVEAIVVIALTYRSGTLSSYGLVALDILTLVVTLWCVNFALKSAANPYDDLFVYPYSVAAMLLVALTVRRLAEALLLPLFVAGCYLAVVVERVGYGGPLLPNCLTYWLWALVPWGFARWYRRLGAELDAARDQVVAREVELAREREHMLSSVFLHNRTLQVMTSALRDGVVDEPTRTRLRVAAAELRGFIEHGLGPGSHDLLTALSDEVHRQTEAGLRIELNAAGLVGRPALAKESVEAVTNAVSAALSNVKAHSGTLFAVVRAVTDGSGVEVTIRDDGSGFDLDRADYGLGIVRSIFGSVQDVGGHAHVEALPGEGTLVRVWVPMTSSESGTLPVAHAERE